MFDEDALWEAMVLGSGLIIALFMCIKPAAAAEAEIERMTSIEVGQAVASGKTTVIIPTGGTEQNGRHMVTGKHNFIVAETSRRIARELGDALVAPVLAYVPEGDIEKRTVHMAYPGTITVPDDVYAAVLESAAKGFKAHGFKTIVLLGDSGENQAPQMRLAEKLSGAWAAEGVRVVNATNYYARNGGADWLKAQGETDAAIGTHAGIRDTSELMAVYPAGVRLGEAHPNADGATGDAAHASAARGEHLLQMKVAAAVAEIKAARSRPIETPGFFTRLWRSIFG